MDDWKLILFGLLLIFLVFLFFAVSGPSAEEVTEVTSKRTEFLHQEIPRDIRDDMNRFERGEFQGQDRSPLTYVGYHVGNSSFLSEADRRQRMLICFVMEIPSFVRRKNKTSWGRPCSYSRYVSITNHVRTNSSRFGSRNNYETAVTEWRGDNSWFQGEFGGFAERLKKCGFK